MPVGLYDLQSNAAPGDSSNLSNVYHQWECPPASAGHDVKLSWLKQSLQNGVNLLRSETAYPSIELGMDAIAAKTVRDYKIGNGKSDEETQIFINRLKRQIREIVSTLSNLNPRWRYESGNRGDDEVIHLLNKRYEHWWATSFADRQIKKALQWASISVGYIAPRWKKNPYTQQPDCVLDVLSPLDVLFDQMGSDMEPQHCYAAHLRYTEPYAQVRKEWYLQRGRIKPDRMGAPVPSSDTGGMRKWFNKSIIYRMFGGGDLNSNAENAGTTTSPEVDLFYTYVLDPSLNISDKVMHTDEFTFTDGEHMTKGTTWDYNVPPLGSPVKTGRKIPQVKEVMSRDEFGNDIPIRSVEMVDEMRPATRVDAQLYPNRRLLIWCHSGILYDGPSFYLHGQVPIVPFKLDEWPWEYLGYSLVSEVATIDNAVNDLIAGAVQTQKVRLDPPTSYSEKEYQRGAMQRLRLRSPGKRIPRTGMQKDAIAPVLPYQHYELPIQLVPFIQMLVEMSDHQQGVNDFSALAKLGQMPSADAMEKMLQAVGPLIQDQARTMERALTLLGYQVMWNFFQFDNTARRLQLFGADGLTKSDFDYSPGQFVPAIVPGVDIEETFAKKAKVWGQSFSFSITPNSAFNITDIQTKLLYLQLWRDPKNFPIDPWSIAKVFNIPNFGKAPFDTMMENFKAWTDWSSKYQLNKQVEAQTALGINQIELQQYAALQQMLQSPEFQALGQLMGQANGVKEGGGSRPPGTQGGAPPTPLGGGPDNSGPQGLTPGQSPRQGRPPEAQEAPSLEMKSDLSGDGPRSTVKESE